VKVRTSSVQPVAQSITCWHCMHPACIKRSCCVPGGLHSLMLISRASRAECCVLAPAPAPIVDPHVQTGPLTYDCVIVLLQCLTFHTEH
jgi:hypothetical protein